MTRCDTADAALDFVRRHGVVLAAARGRAPRLTEAIAGEPIAGSWWTHPHSHRIYAILSAVSESPDVLVCRLLDGKITLVHRRLWPSLVRLAQRFGDAPLAQVRDTHTASGRHETATIPYPRWVPADVATEAAALDERTAAAALAAWLPPASSPGANPRRARRTAR